jgi:hypothetical protein
MGKITEQSKVFQVDAVDSRGKTALTDGASEFASKIVCEQEENSRVKDVEDPTIMWA